MGGDWTWFLLCMSTLFNRDEDHPLSQCGAPIRANGNPLNHLVLSKPSFSRSNVALRCVIASLTTTSPKSQKGTRIGVVCGVCTEVHVSANPWDRNKVAGRLLNAPQIWTEKNGPIDRLRIPLLCLARSCLLV